jgi:hypothetical protein
MDDTDGEDRDAAAIPAIGNVAPGQRNRSHSQDLYWSWITAVVAHLGERGPGGDQVVDQHANEEETRSLRAGR